MLPIVHPEEGNKENKDNSTPNHNMQHTQPTQANYTNLWTSPFTSDSMGEEMCSTDGGFSQEEIGSKQTKTARMKSWAKCTQSCNYTEWGPIRWIRASPFKSHFGPVITLGAINRDAVRCPGNCRGAWTARSSDLPLTPFFLAPVIKWGAECESCNVKHAVQPEQELAVTPQNLLPWH